MGFHDTKITYFRLTPGEEIVIDFYSLNTKSIMWMKYWLKN